MYYIYLVAYHHPLELFAHLLLKLFLLVAYHHLLKLFPHSSIQKHHATWLMMEAMAMDYLYLAVLAVISIVIMSTLYVTRVPYVCNEYFICVVSTLYVISSETLKNERKGKKQKP